MGRTYTLEEIAALAGVDRDVVLGWDAQGRLSSARPAGGGGRAFGFEDAVMAVALGERATRRRIAVVNQKGGVGKTTTVFNLAGALADLGRRVLCVDLDAQASLTTSFGYEPDGLDRTAMDLLADERVTAEDVILETAVEGVHLVPADIRLCQADVELHARALRETALAGKLRHLFRWYHVILFDGPPNLSKVTVNALLASEEVVVPVETQAYSAKALADLANTLAVLRQRLGHALRTWVLPSKYDPRTPYAETFLEALGSAYGAQVLPPLTHDPALVRAPLTYEPVGRSYPRSQAAAEFGRLARFLVLPDGERDAATRREAPPPRAAQPAPAR